MTSQVQRTLHDSRNRWNYVSRSQLQFHQVSVSWIGLGDSFMQLPIMLIYLYKNKGHEDCHLPFSKINYMDKIKFSCI